MLHLTGTQVRDWFKNQRTHQNRRKRKRIEQSRLSPKSRGRDFKDILHTMDIKTLSPNFPIFTIPPFGVTSLSSPIPTLTSQSPPLCTTVPTGSDYFRYPPVFASAPALTRVAGFPLPGSIYNHPSAATPMPSLTPVMPGSFPHQSFYPQLKVPEHAGEF